VLCPITYIYYKDTGCKFIFKHCASLGGKKLLLSLNTFG
jgi:hypothetical protein